MPVEGIDRNELEELAEAGASVTVPASLLLALIVKIEKLEEEALRQALLECEGNISQTAKKLGIGRATIYRKAKKYGLPMVK